MSNPPATPNTNSLCSLSQMSCGTAVTSPASAAPAPSATRTAGNTQHTRVAELVRSAAANRAALRVKAEWGRSWLALFEASPYRINRFISAPNADHLIAGVSQRLAQIRIGRALDMAPSSPCRFRRRRLKGVAFFVWSSCSHFLVLARQRRPREVTPVRLPDLGRGRPSIRCDILSQFRTHDVV
jgi:hypothetical protein